MRSRLCGYTIGFLFALVLSILPAALWIDQISSVNSWETWSRYWPGQPAPVPDFHHGPQPLLMRAESLTFKALAIPPGMLRYRLTGWSTEYAFAWVMPPGVSGEGAASLPPIALALDHVRWAMPIWFGGYLVLFEISMLVRRSRSRRHVAAQPVVAADAPKAARR